MPSPRRVRFAHLHVWITDGPITRTRLAPPESYTQLPGGGGCTLCASRVQIREARMRTIMLWALGVPVLVVVILMMTGLV